jgi:heme O synthase-like polyprenyltransferase
MSAILKDKSFQLSIILTTIFIGTGIAFLFFGLVDYSWILFGLLPVVLGVAIGTMKVRKYALWGAMITTILLLIAIYIPGLSGVICIVMAIGLVVPFIFLGYVIARLVKRYKLIKETNRFSVLLLPLIPFLIAAPAEHFS